MNKKEYMRPTVTVVQLQHSQHILASSYTDVRTTSDDEDDPDYDTPRYDGKSRGSMWDAN